MSLTCLRGLVGYDASLTLMRSPVRTRARTIFCAYGHKSTFECQISQMGCQHTFYDSVFDVSL